MEHEGGTLDFYKANGYDEYDKVYESLPDDDSMIPDVLAELKRNFRTGVTQDIEFRISQLKAIIKGIETHYDLIVDAMQKDLKRGKYETTMAELAGVKNEIFDTIKNLKNWAKDQ